MSYNIFHFVSVASKLNQINNLKDENEELKCQIEVYKNEHAVLQQENSCSSTDRDKEFKSLQMAMQGMQQVQLLVSSVPFYWSIYSKLLTMVHI